MQHLVATGHLQQFCMIDPPRGAPSIRIAMPCKQQHPDAVAKIIGREGTSSVSSACATGLDTSSVGIASFEPLRPQGSTWIKPTRCDSRASKAPEPSDGLGKPISNVEMQRLYGKGFGMVQKKGFIGAGEGLGRQCQGIARPVDALVGSRRSGQKQGLGWTFKIAHSKHEKKHFARLDTGAEKRRQCKQKKGKQCKQKKKGKQSKQKKKGKQCKQSPSYAPERVKCRRLSEKQDTFDQTASEANKTLGVADAPGSEADGSHEGGYEQSHIGNQGLLVVDAVEIFEDDEIELLHNGMDGSEPLVVGETVQAYWPDSDEWLPAVVHEVFGDGSSLQIHWEHGHEQSHTVASYVRRPA